MRRRGAPAPRRKAFETWQIIYIDLMTNVMIFFVILWAITQRQESKGISDTIGTETVKQVNLPGDVLFPPAKSELSPEGREVFSRLFSDPTGQVLNFDTGGLVKRLLVVHGHTDSDGDKEANLTLGYQRAMAAYKELRKYGEEAADHVVICSHADNTPELEVPEFTGTLSAAELNVVREAKSKNRRITIEDKLLSRVKEPEAGK
jgi:outer membrane protein OmpA-like peptidoglycan-associated protein